MNGNMQFNYSKPLIYVLGFIIVASLGYGGYNYVLTLEELKKVGDNLALSRAEFEGKIERLETENANLAESLAVERAKNNSFEEQIGAIQGSVGVLEKLKKTDEELLKKYSKVYFLSENYVPSKLADIDSRYVYNKDETLQIHASVEWFLYNMFQGASSDGVSLRIISAYRSFGAQSSLKLSYKMTYGSGANKFSADQGYSEHQLGTALDFTTPETGESFLKFEKTTAFKWLTENAYKYGFVLSYPKGNAYYQYEPWHWRFVGVALAKYLHDNNKYFYDMDQREIDLYLISIFD
jgi:D-alanyl-D-alanine carboxypeptidase